MKIEFVDLYSQYLSIKKDIDGAINKTLSNASFIGGEEVNNFEKNFCELNSVRNCISVANGTDSLFIIMKMLGIGEGDEVITSAYSWISSAETIVQTGATPVFVDIDEYFTIDANKLEAKITKNTKAVLVVHIHGQVCDMEQIQKICNEKNIKIIEDCAQSHFSEFNKTYVGKIGIAGSFSFYPGKNLGAYGDAGCIITNDDDLAEKCRMYARHGGLKKHEHVMCGINSRMDTIQAGILNVKLKHILNWTEKRKNVASWYNSLLANTKGIKLPKVRNNTSHSYHLYVILADDRDLLQEYLSSNSISTALHYPKALPNLPAFEFLKIDKNDFQLATSNEGKLLSLPIYPELTYESVEFICTKIKEFYQKKSF